MTILVTGGAGFIGSNFVLDWFAQSDETIVNLDKLTYAGNLENLSSLDGDSRHEFVRGDIADSTLVSRLLSTYRPRAILNFAAESHVDRSISGPGSFIQTNIIGTFTLLEAARAYFNELDPQEKSKFRFLHVSTDEVYGTLGAEEPTFTERHPYEPNSPYSASKASSDHLVRAYHHTYGLPTLTTNCSNNYGPYQYPEKLIPLTITKALSGQPIPIYGDGQQIRDWLYVGDHCGAVRRVLAAGVPGEVYNVGGLNERTNIQIIDSICDRLSSKIKNGSGTDLRELKTFVADRPGHDRRYAINAEKIQTELGWTPIETFETGIVKTIDWYLANANWLGRLTKPSQAPEVKTA
jgi:dTDP-glucose 4,6-dehydratase